MIDALFSQPDYLAAKKTLDVVQLRQEAIATNVANLETPGYKRIDVAPTFEAELQRAVASGDPNQIAALKPMISTDPTAVPNSRDGNTVTLENEMAEMNQNSLLHMMETQMVSYSLNRMKMAITGKSS